MISTWFQTVFKICSLKSLSVISMGRSENVIVWKKPRNGWQLSKHMLIIMSNTFFDSNAKTFFRFSYVPLITAATDHLVYDFRLVFSLYLIFRWIKHTYFSCLRSWLNFPPHFVYDISIKLFLMLGSINWSNFISWFMSWDTV